MPEVTCIDRFEPALQTPKRIKIFVGGRASTKTTFVADVCLARLTQGEIWCNSREFQNSITDSVHRTLVDEQERCGFEDFFDKSNQLHHPSGGRAFYKGLARNIESLKGMLSGVDVLWIEEGETITEETLRVLTASLRVSAKDAQKVLDGEIAETKIPEVWITMNRRSREDAIAKRYLARAEADLEACGFYEDDNIMVIQANYTDMPKKWFDASGLNTERLDDLARMSRAEYDHKWHGRYLEDVENSIIKSEWFDAAVDSMHKLKLESNGVHAGSCVVGAFDPSDVGNDPKGYAFRQGIHFFDYGECKTEDGNAACDEVTALARQHDTELFVWDGDGMGALLRRQVEESFTRCQIRMYKGSNTPDNPDLPYEGSWAEGQKTNKQLFHNKRAQYYTKLAERFYATYRAVELQEYVNPELLISIESSNPFLNKLKAEVCRMPRKINPTSGKVQIMSKVEMKRKYKINSPNMADCLAMSMESPDVTKSQGRFKFESFWS